MQCVQTMTHQMASLSTTVQAAHPSPDPWAVPAPAPTGLGSVPLPPTPSSGIHEPRLPPPERYDGSPGECRTFLTQCQLIFSLQPSSFPTDATRVAYIVTQLTGKAKNWRQCRRWIRGRCGWRSLNSLAPSRHVALCRKCIGFSTGPWWDTTRVGRSSDFDRGTAPYLTTPWSSRPWRLTVAGKGEPWSINLSMVCQSRSRMSC